MLTTWWPLDEAMRGSGDAPFGPIAKIGDTHQAVCQWSAANGYRLAGPHWEIYGDPDPSGGHFDVQVFWSLVAP
jgi:hypothetical protein